ncbi:uncharacterized protein [Dysidea avara]|uniref:uncharacterized protein n=1 Tax=Dysidea avara TaxID=196820 RepID=UPI00331B44AA
MSASKFFPSTRHFNFIYYHPFGNTPPEDLLQSVCDGVEFPEVLILGCGDIRSCFYTLWNNFDPQHSRSFKGVHFVLNDSSVAVVARNVLFLYMCTQMPSDQAAVKKWIASFWSIWFCHELLPDHNQVLTNILSLLVKWSKDIDTWSSSVGNPLKSLVQFATTGTIKKVNKIWAMWLNGNCTIHEMTANKMESFKPIPEYYTMQDPTAQLIRCFGSVLVKNVSPIKREIMKDEIASYYKSGNAFAEEVLCLPVKRSASINNSFLERLDNIYTTPCTSIPYRCFYHTFQFSPNELRRRKLSKYPLLVEGGEFVKQPLLANSVQQFSIWIQSCARTLCGKQHVIFTVQCSDALELCQQLHGHPQLFSCSVPSLFDAVYSSNLMDFTAPPSLVLLAMSVLKDSGLLFAMSFHSTVVFNTAYVYLKEMFGFDCKYFPVLIGARCIGVESEYSGKVSLKPVPYDLASSYTTFIWQRTTATMLTQVPQKDMDNMFKVLGDAIVHSVGYPLEDGGKSRMKSLLCSETAILMLQSFVAQLDPEWHDCGNDQFWAPLCSLLLSQKCMKAFHTSLQTHALLHGLHLHLTVSKETCPVCNKRPTTDFIKQCSVKIVHGGVNYDEPRYAIIIHHRTISFNMYTVWKQITSGCDDDVHVIDCLAGSEVDGALKFDFFAPQELLSGEYTLTVISMNFNRVVPFSVVRTLDKQIGETTYTFSSIVHCLNSTQSIFGKLFQHYGDADHFESIVSLSDEALSALQEKKLSTRLSSCATLTLVAGNHSMTISYPYPVEYGKVSVTLSRKKRMVAVVARRKSYCLYEEGPAFIVNPDNALALPTTCIRPEDASVFSGFQYSREDRVLMNKLGRQISLMPAEINVKETMSCFFQQRECCFQLVNQTSSLKSIVGLVVVRDQLFDLANKTPAIDLYFCFVTKESCKKIYKNWMRFCTSIAPCAREIFVDSTECQLLEELFVYFSSRTVTTTSKPAMGGHIKEELADNKIDHLFTRAVVYPLYPHQDVFTGTSGPLVVPQYSTEPLKDRDKCSYCGQSAVDLKKCSRCRSVQYCGRDCQKKHWTSHKPDCH